MPALFLTPNGYILDIHGLYLADSRNNDAEMLQSKCSCARGTASWEYDSDH